MTLHRSSFSRPSRRDLMLAVAGTSAVRAETKRDRPPNILMVVASDVGAWMLGCYGNREIKTPNIDALARGGIRFLSAIVCTPSSSPSRATLFTGRTPMQHGVQDFLTDRPTDEPAQGQFAPSPTFEKEIMLSDILAQRGYRCGYVGKWHMGSDQNPQHHFDQWYTLAPQPSGYRNPRISDNGQLRDEQGYVADLITDRAVRFLEAQSPDRPFFLVAGHLNAQPPYDDHPRKYYDMYAGTKFDTIGWQRAAPNASNGKEHLRDAVGNLRRAAAGITALDDQLPPLLRKLQDRGLRDNTLIMLVGDTGFLLGRHGLWTDGHASTPINMYEETVQTPMIFTWPGKTPVQSARPEVVSFYDVLPTLCEAAGVDAPSNRKFCGRSYLPLIQGRQMPAKQPWRNLVFGRLRNTDMARDNRFKLVIRDDGKGPNELFDLRGDPREGANQYDNPQFLTVRDRLARDLTAWKKQYSV